MPKFKDKKSRDSFRKKQSENAAWRVDEQAGLILEVTSRDKFKPMTWQQIDRLAVNHFRKHQKSIKRRNPRAWLRVDGKPKSDKFVSEYGRIRKAKSKIRTALLDDGWILAEARDPKNNRVCGLFLSQSTKDFDKFFSRQRTIIEKSAKKNNDNSEIANERKSMQLPLFQHPLPKQLDSG